MPPLEYGTRPGSDLAFKAARRGWALVRTAALVVATGFIVALVLAAVFAGLVVAINGELP
jgi:hypothetical protein